MTPPPAAGAAAANIISPPKIQRSLEYFNTFKKNDDLDLAKSNLAMELKRRATLEEAVIKADEQDKEAAEMRQHFREKCFEPAILAKAQGVHQLQLHGHLVMTKKEVLESLNDMIW